MTLRPLIVSLFLICISLTTVAQDYTEGFEMLEKGNFKQAAVFFKDKLDNGATDFTARLCYGRAIGLNGNTNEASSIFQDMSKEFPDHFELELNYAESLMWAKDYLEAKERYEALYRRDSSSFGAVLGYANVLANLKDYEHAAIYIDKALNLMKDNPNALLSRKYILLGYANAGKLEGNYSKADSLLSFLEESYSGDLDITLAKIYLKLDQDQFKVAKGLTKEAISRHPNDYRPYLILSSLMLKEIKYGKALQYLDSARTEANLPKDQIPYEILNHEFNIHLSRNKFSQAERVLDSIKSSIFSNHYVEMKTNLLLAKKDYDGLEKFVKENNNEDLYFIAMTKISIQQGQYRAARNYLDQVPNSEYNTISKYYLGKEIDQHFHHNISSGLEIMEDNGGNHAQELNLRGTTSSRNNGQAYFALKQRKVMTNGLEAAKTQKVEVGMIYNFHKNLAGQLNIGYNILENTDRVRSANFQYFGNLKYNFTGKHFLSMAFKQNTFDYNADLINQSIIDNKIQVQYYNMFISNFGGFLEANRSYLSDGNSSNFAFVSLFYNLSSLPILQTGVNYTYIKYAEDSPLYFSPESYNVKEVFLKFDNRYQPTKKIILSALAGVGQQNINDEEVQFTQRLDLEIGYKFKYGSSVWAYYNYNNASSAVLSGYKVQRLGLRVSINI